MEHKKTKRAESLTQEIVKRIPYVANDLALSLKNQKKAEAVKKDQV